MSSKATIEIRRRKFSISQLRKLSSPELYELCDKIAGELLAVEARLASILAKTRAYKVGDDRLERLNYVRLVKIQQIRAIHRMITFRDPSIKPSSDWAFRKAAKVLLTDRKMIEITQEAYKIMREEKDKPKVDC